MPVRAVGLTWTDALAWQDQTTSVLRRRVTASRCECNSVRARRGYWILDVLMIDVADFSRSRLLDGRGFDLAVALHLELPGRTDENYLD